MTLAQAAKLHGLYNGKYVFISLDLYTWELNTGTPAFVTKYPEDLLAGWFDVSSKSMLASVSGTKQTFFLRDLQQRLLQDPFYMQVNEVSI